MDRDVCSSASHCLLPDMPTSNMPLLKNLVQDSAVWPFSALYDHRRSSPARNDQGTATIVRAAESRDSLYTAAASRQAQTDEDEWGAWVDARDANHSPNLEIERREEDEWAAWAEDTATPPDGSGDTVGRLEQNPAFESSRRSRREVHDQEQSPWDVEESSSSFVSPRLENSIELNDAADDLHANPWDDDTDRRDNHVTSPLRRTTSVQESRERRRHGTTPRVMRGSISDQHPDDDQWIHFNPWK